MSKRDVHFEMIYSHVHLMSPHIDIRSIFGDSGNRVKRVLQSSPVRADCRLSWDVSSVRLQREITVMKHEL